MSVQVSYKNQFLVGCLFFLIILIVVEGSARIYELSSPLCSYLKSDVFEGSDYFKIREVCNAETLIRYDSDPIIHYIPNQHFSTLNINSHGFRGDEFEKEKSSDTYRILVVGGSTTFGIGSTSDKTTIPGYLQKLFTNFDSELNVQVINAGINGAESSRISYLIEDTLIEYDPNLIIIFDGVNDSMRVWEDKSLDPYFNISNNIKEKEFDIKSLLFEFKNFPFYRTPLVINNILIEHTLFLHPGTSTDKIFHYPEVADIWYKNHNQSCELGIKNNFKTIVLLQPSLGSGNKIFSKGELVTSQHQLKIKGLQDNFQSISEKLDDLKENCSKVIDMRDTFDKISEPVFIDLVHTSDFGNQIIAEHIFKNIYSIVYDDIVN